MAEHRSTVANQLIPQQSKDKLFISLLIFAMVGGLYLSLMSAGFLLAFNTNTLMIAAIIFTITSSNWILQAKPIDIQIKYAALCLVPIGLRFVFNLPIFTSYTVAMLNEESVKQLIFMMQVTALWILVAVCEETFRATMMNFAEVLMKWKDQEINMTWRALFANSVWLLFHFIQRPFDPIAYKWYILWLFISGLVMTYTLVKGGLGSACLLHFLINISA